MPDEAVLVVVVVTGRAFEVVATGRLVIAILVDPLVTSEGRVDVVETPEAEGRVDEVATVLPWTVVALGLEELTFEALVLETPVLATDAPVLVTEAPVLVTEALEPLATSED